MYEAEVKPVMTHGGFVKTEDPIEALTSAIRLGHQTDDARTALKNFESGVFSIFLAVLRDCYDKYVTDPKAPAERECQEALADFESYFEQAKAKLIELGEYTPNSVDSKSLTQYMRDISRACNMACPVTHTNEDGTWFISSKGKMNQWSKSESTRRDEEAAEKRRLMRAERAVKNGEATSIEDALEKQKQKASESLQAKAPVESPHVVNHDKDDPFTGLREDTKDMMMQIIAEVRKLDRGDGAAHDAVMDKLRSIRDKQMDGLRRHVANILKAAKAAEKEAA